MPYPCLAYVFVANICYFPHLCWQLVYSVIVLLITVKFGVFKVMLMSDI